MGLNLNLKRTSKNFQTFCKDSELVGTLPGPIPKLTFKRRKSLIPGNSDPSSPEYHEYNVAERMNRALQGQSEWIYTIDLSYSNEDLGLVSTLVYSYYGDRLFQSAPNYLKIIGKTDFQTLTSSIPTLLERMKIGK